MTASDHESGGGDRVTGTGHDDPPGKQVNANARAGTGSSQKTETGPGESDPDEAGSGPKIATGQGGIHDPSVFLGQKTGKHGRIENGSGPPKTPPTHQLAERAVISGGEPTEKEEERATSDRRSWIFSPRRSRGDRSELARSGRASRGTSTPLGGTR